MPRRCLLLIVTLVLWPTVAVAQGKDKRPMKVADLFAFQRVADPQVSPDGKSVSYTLATVDLKGNKISSAVWLASTTKPEERQLLTKTPKASQHARWSHDGKTILFESAVKGENQVFLFDRETGKSKQLTSLATGAGNAIWSPDDQWIGFVSSVYPEYSARPFKESDALNQKRMDEEAKNPVKAMVFDKLFFRHWNQYLKGKRKHLFVIPAAGGEPRDVTPGDRDFDPVSFTFSMGQDFTFSPDSKHLYFTAAPAKGEAWSTNYDICKVPISGGKIETVTKDNLAADGAPRFSPDGRWLAYRAQTRPGFEADRWQLFLMPLDGGGKKKSLTANFDGPIEDFVWHPLSTTIYFCSEEKGHGPIYTLSVNDGTIKKLVGKHSNRGLSISKDGKTLAFGQSSLTFPPEACIYASSGEVRNVSQANADLLKQLDLPQPESVTVAGADGTPMQMWILKPPGFVASKKWPLAYLVHGGPQGAWNDSWSFRWCPEVWAAQGYVTALPNPRGSTGFGQKYVDDISGDWGGKAFDDLMAGVAYLEKQPWIDTDRMASAGASYGGYMMNWFQGHTTKFKTLITHCGVYNLESMYGTTEELWFVEWDVGGKPWTDPEKYKKFSPHNYAKNFKTPMLITHGELDFRVPVSEGLQLFTTLQRQGVPSKMIAFPDEGHFVSRPRNSEYWHNQVFAWMKKYAPPGPR